MISEVHPLCENIGVNGEGHLTFAGQDTTLLAQEYGTPLYLLDEDRVRQNCRTYTETFRRLFPSGSRPLYASKANCFAQIYRILREEGMGADVVSCGEIFTALRADFPVEALWFHSNNKTDEDIRFAMKHGVGCFVVDGEDELLAIEREAAALGKTQTISLRLTPGIDPHTYAAVNTGEVDCKFGTAIETGQAEILVKRALSLPHIALSGFHCHVGSQVFTEDVFERAAVIMLRFLAHIFKETGYLAETLNLGGGYGVRYVESDAHLDIAEKLASVAAVIRSECAALNIREPAIFMEPGRSIVADAGMTLYTVGSLKRIPNCKSYVSVDGGMGDNPRFALYGSRYTCFAANKAALPCDEEFSLVGRCCESGDILQEGVRFPKSIARGDLVAVATTGAYNYSMASNYNRIPRPPIVMLRGGESYVAVRRESLRDLAWLDL